MKRKEWLRLLLADAITVFLLLTGGLLSGLSAYGIPAYGTALLLAGAVLAPLAALLWSWSRGHWPALALLAAGLLALWRIREGLKSLLNPSPGLEELLALPAAQILLEALLALALGWVAVRARCWYLAALLVITPTLPAILAGVLPEGAALLAATAGWLAMLLASFYSRRDPASLGRGLLVSLGGAGALLAVLAAALPMEGYTRPQWATNARAGLLSAIAEQVRELEGTLDWEVPPLVEEYLRLDGGGPSPEGEGTGAVPFAVSEEGTVDLLAAGPRRYTGRTVLEVEGEGTGRIYLRGGGAGVYTGSGWEALPETDWLWQAIQRDADSWIDPLLHPALRCDSAEIRETAIRRVSAGSAVYYPYYFVCWTAGDSGWPGGLWGTPPTIEGSLFSEEQSYRVSSVDWPEAGFPPEDAQPAYRDFVYSRYLDVPRWARSALAPLLAEAERSPIRWPSELPERFQESAAAAERVAAALAEAARYDLSTPAMEPGEDFVAHFLEEGRGYCVHFATAGALLLRMQGIPTRYVSGYVADLDGSGYAAVPDSAAHAWVEIYLDGFGWYPVEMTPSYSGPGEEADVPGENREEDLEEPPPPQVSDTPEKAPQTPPETPDTPPDGPDTPEPPEGDAPEAAPLDLGWLWWALPVLAALAAPGILYRLALLSRRRTRDQADANRSAIAAYRRSLRLDVWGGGESPALTDLARKAKFSQHTLTQAERERAWSLLEERFRETRAGLPRRKRWLLGLLRPLF